MALFRDYSYLKKFYATSLGSLRESVVALKLAGIENEKFDDIADKLGALLYTMVFKRG